MNKMKNNQILNIFLFFLPVNDVIKMVLKFSGFKIKNSVPFKSKTI